MRPLLSGILYGLLGLVFLFMAGMGVYRGHITFGKYHHTTYYAATNPHGFWLVVGLHVAFGVAIIVTGVVKIIRGG
jgi:hypothetical protein